MRNNLLLRLSRHLFISGLVLLLAWSQGWALGPAGDEETMLMFVGETEQKVTVASRAPESPVTAPAMVTLVTREDIERRGYRTLAELLSAQPGFFMVGAGRGSVPYLRGLRDAVLFLYDGVPLTTDVSKTFAPLDEDMSLHNIERVEIIYGPGSVLWGPDAFAGVVNIVPRRGGDLGGDLSLHGGNHEARGANLGVQGQVAGWRGRLDYADSRRLFQESEVTTNQDAGEIDPSRYRQASAVLDYGDSFQLTLRGSDFTRRYTQTNPDESLRWRGEKETPINLVKATFSQVVGASHYTLSGYYLQSRYEVLDSDIERRQRNDVGHVELLWDRRLFGKGLLTLGGSWRETRVRDALVRDGFLPDFLETEQPLFTPEIGQADYRNRLFSLFGQMRWQWRDTHFWLGARVDDHNQYESTCSYSLGFTRAFGKRVNLKGNYGTAYRSPYSRQLFENQDFDPEGISTASFQLEWSTPDGATAQATLFHSRVRDHRSEDPYGGLSVPQDLEIYGGEIALHTPRIYDLQLYGGFGIHDYRGDDTRFHALRFVYVRPDGSQVPVYDDWREPVDQGPGWQAYAGLSWRPSNRYDLDISGQYADDIAYSYSKDSVGGHYSQEVVVHLTARMAGFFEDDRFTLRVRDLFDRGSRQPDLYGPVDPPGRQVEVFWNYAW